MCFGYWLSPLRHFFPLCGSCRFFRFRHPNMTHINGPGFLFLLLCFAGRAMSACRSPYLDLCGYNGNDNATEYEDYNEVYNFCDCQQVTYCSVIDLSEKCNSATILFNTNENISVSTEIYCSVSPLESQTNTPGYKIQNRTGNNFVISIFTEFDFGRYRIACETFGIVEESSDGNDTQWDIVTVNPAEVVVDTEVKLQLTVTRDSQTSLTPIWCFIKTPDNTTLILSATEVSNTLINCTGFNPAIPGTYTISLGSSLTTNTFEKGINLKVTSKRPVVQEAKYSYDFESIFIGFDENVELRSTCGSVFPQGVEYFGMGFDCYTRANALVVKMGQGFKVVSSVVVNAKRKICGAGSESCLTDSSVNLPVLKPKLSGPNLSFHINAACTGDTTQKYMSVSVVPPRQTSLSAPQQQAPPKTSGKRQRKNLIIWRMIRQFQNKLSARHIVMQLNTTDVYPLSESLSSVDNVLAVDDNLASTASVSVLVQSSPGSTSVLAEATVTFCGKSDRLFRYKWTVSGRDVFEDGKLLLLNNLVPGKYVIKCAAVDYNSAEVLGQGWVTTEIFPVDEKVIIVPSEITVGRTNDVFLRAMTWHGNSVSWTCRTGLDGGCLTTDNKSLSELVNLNSPNITIPAGSLPVGNYVWRVESGRGSSEARVFVRDGNVTPVGVEITSVFVKPSEEFVAKGTVGRVQRGCRVWWSSVRQKGFEYFHLNTVSDNPVERQLPLVIHPGDWKTPQPDTQYLFQLQVFCPYSPNNQNGSFDYLKLPLVVSNPPRVSPLTVQPLTGEAMITIFEVFSTEAVASADDYPLTYEWSYIDPCDLEVVIARGAFPRNFTTYLPPGDVRLALKVCNGKKTCSATSTPVIRVIQSSEFPGDSFRNARNQIQHLLAGGGIAEGFGLATTVFKSLAFLAEGTVREDIYATVEKAIVDRIEELTKRARTDVTTVSSCLEFFERAATVAKYLRKGSGIMSRLSEFKKIVLTIQNPK